METLLVIVVFGAMVIFTIFFKLCTFYFDKKDDQERNPQSFSYEVKISFIPTILVLFISFLFVTISASIITPSGMGQLGFGLAITFPAMVLSACSVLLSIFTYIYFKLIKKL